MRLPIPRLITFDVTGTLLMTKLEQHYVEAAASHGLNRIDVPRIAKAFKTNFKRLENEHPIYGKNTGLGWQNWWRSLVHEVFRDQDRAICTEKLDKVSWIMIVYLIMKIWQFSEQLELLQYSLEQFECASFVRVLKRLFIRLGEEVTSTDIEYVYLLVAIVKEEYCTCDLSASRDGDYFHAIFFCVCKLTSNTCLSKH